MSGDSAAVSARRQVRARLKALRTTAGLSAPSPGFRQRVREIILVASSSRGGSSVFAEMLRQSTGLLHLPGELTPILALCGETYPYSGTGSDALREGRSPAVLDEVGDELAYECGKPKTSICSDADIAHFALRLTVRLTLQWNEVAFELRKVEACVRESLDVARRLLQWKPGELRDTGAFHAIFLRALRRLYPEVLPQYYDIDAATRRAFLSGEPAAHGPPTRFLFEEPPFICVGPWQPASDQELLDQPLVIKTPSNAYRLGYLRALFPNALIRILHLTRNPAAAINGLCEGWQYPSGFFSHRVPAPLRIKGYSDLYPDWGVHWWNFDLPPHWQSTIALDLEEVCAIQWSQMHRTILDYLRLDAHAASRSLRLKFEDLVGGQRSALVRRDLQRWLSLGVCSRKVELPTEPLPITMATSPPVPGRWRKRRPLLELVTRRNDIRGLAEELGYGCDSSAWD